MTREELKEHCLKQIENCEMWARCKGEEPHGKIYEEHKLILELLEQEPTTKNKLGVDAISRADARSLICKIDIQHQTFGMSRKAFRDLYNGMDELPSVTPQEPGWIPVKFRPLTDEEQNKYPDYCYMADCPMPDDGEEMLVCTVYGTVEKDECGFDDGFYLDSGYDWQTDIIAWMPLPKPYREVEE